MQPLWKTIWSFLKKGKNRTAIWSSNFTFVYLLKENKSTSLKRYTHPMFTVALSTIAKIWKQPQCPPIDEWIKKMWYIYTHSGILLSHKKWNIAISDMDESKVHYTKSDRERQISYDLTYMWNLKKQNENRLIDINRWLAW